MQSNPILTIGLIIIGIAVVTTGPVLKKILYSVAETTPPGELYFPTTARGWSGPVFGVSDWRPEYRNPTQAHVGTYRRDGLEIDVALVRYRGAKTDAELANSENRIADPTRWRLGTARERRLDAGGTIDAVDEIRIANANGTRLVWYWYDVNGSRTSRLISIKALEAKNILRARPSESALVAVSARAVPDEATARKALGEFLEDMEGVIRACLYAGSDTLSCTSPDAVGSEF